MAYINVDEVYILDNTGLQVDMATDIPFADAGFTDAQKEQARANIGAGGTNPNLLDNPFLSSDVVINQRGATSGTIGTTSTYTVDRWILNRCSYSVTNSGLQHSWDGVNSTSGTISQRTGRFDIIGKTVTFSVILDGELYSFTTTAPSSGAVDKAVTANIGMRVAYNSTYGINVVLFNYSTTAVTIQAMKLELGSVSTLANDAPPNYAEELAKCQYYCPVIDFPTYGTIAAGYATSSTAAYFIISLPANIRTLPTMTYSGSLRLFVPALNSSISVSGLAVAGSANTPCSNQIALTATVASGLTAGQLVSLGGYGTAGKIILSADL